MVRVALSVVGMLRNYLCSTGIDQGLTVRARPAPSNAKAELWMSDPVLAVRGFSSISQNACNSYTQELIFKMKCNKV